MNAPTPWIWVQTQHDDGEAYGEPTEAFLQEVAAIEESLSKDGQAIADDASLPVNGKNSKAKARAAKHVETVEALATTAKKVRCLSWTWRLCSRVAIRGSFVRLPPLAQARSTR